MRVMHWSTVVALVRTMVPFLLKSNSNPCLTLRVLIVCFCCCTGLGVWNGVHADDPVYRHRTMGMVAIVWRTLVPFFGLRLKPCAFCLVVGTINEVCAVNYVLTRYGDASDWVRIIIMVHLNSIAGFGWCYAVQTWRATLYKTLRQMEIEKEACQYPRWAVHISARRQGEEKRGPEKCPRWNQGQRQSGRAI